MHKCQTFKTAVSAFECIFLFLINPLFFWELSNVILPLKIHVKQYN